MTKMAPHTAHTVWFTYNEMSIIGKYVEVENRLLVSWGKGLRKDWEVTAKEGRVEGVVMKIF